MYATGLGKKMISLGQERLLGSQKLRRSYGMHPIRHPEEGRRRFLRERTRSLAAVDLGFFL